MGVPDLNIRRYMDADLDAVATAISEAVTDASIIGEPGDAP